MQEVGRGRLPMWRIALSSVALVAVIGLAIWASLLNPTDGPDAGSAAPSAAQLARLFTGAAFVLVVVGELLLWHGRRTRLRCPQCGYTCLVDSMQLRYVDRDERFDRLRQGATPMQRVGMAAERYGSWASDVGPTPDEQGRRSRTDYGRMGVLVLVMVVVAMLIVLVGAAVAMW